MGWAMLFVVLEERFKTLLIKLLWVFICLRLVFKPLTKVVDFLFAPLADDDDDIDEFLFTRDTRPKALFDTLEFLGSGLG